MHWVDRLQNIDRRIIYVLLLVVCCFPLIRPLGIPLPISPMTEIVYNIVEGLDPATDTALIVSDYEPGNGLDAHVVPSAVVEHLTRRGIKWVSVSFNANGPMMNNILIDELETRGYKYGNDFANLGYLAGDENAVRLFALDCLTIPTDIRGNKVADLPVMQGIKTVKDFAFVFQFNALGPEAWARQVIDPMGINYVLGTVTVSVPTAMPYYNSGQLKGLLGGLKAGAEYEALLQKPGRAAAMMDAQSMAHLLIIGFIALGNIGYFLGKNKK